MVIPLIVVEAALLCADEKAFGRLLFGELDSVTKGFDFTSYRRKRK
jgi:hypothetical protein